MEKFHILADFCEISQKNPLKARVFFKKFNNFQKKIGKIQYNFPKLHFFLILAHYVLVCMTNSIEIATRYFPFFGDPTGLKNAFKFRNGHPWNDISLLKWSLSFRYFIQLQ